MLCDLCRDFAISVVRQDFSEKWTWQYDERGLTVAVYGHGDRQMIERSAKANCQFCRFFFLVCRQPESIFIFEDRVFSEILLKVHEGRTSLPRGFEKSFVFTFKPPGTGLSEKFEVCAPEDISIEHNVTSLLPRRFLASFTSAAVKDRVLKWLAQCRGSHERCHHGRNPRMPTRLIDVGVDEAFRDVRLTESNGRSGDYLTLSYCWGSAHPYQTTKENLQAIKIALDFDMLPGTIKDAIRFTRLLGFQHIWIDALCIVQNDPDDWERESARMCSVYEAATLSLSVLDAEDCGAGFLNCVPLPERLYLGDSCVTVGLRRWDPLLRCALSRCKLERRAWALQERALAPAILHFASDVIFWECCSAVASQDNENFEDAGFLHVYPMPGETDNLFASRPIVRTSTTEQDSRVWYKLAENYSRRALSDASDRTIAIQGLAERIQRSRSDKYILGHWSDFLHFDLLWTADSRLQRSSKPTKRTSWNWLTAGIPISFPAQWDPHNTTKDEFFPEAEITILESRNQPPLPEVAPFLRLCGRYKSGVVQNDKHHFSRFWTSGEEAKHYRTSICSTLDAPIGRHDDRSEISVGSAIGSGDMVYCLLLAYHEMSHATGELDRRYLYLLLEAIDICDTDWKKWIIRHSGGIDDSKKYYQRIGVARQYLPHMPFPREKGEPHSSDKINSLHSDWKYGDLIIV